MQVNKKYNKRNKNIRSKEESKKRWVKVIDLREGPIYSKIQIIRNRFYIFDNFSINFVLFNFM